MVNYLIMPGYTRHGVSTPVPDVMTLSYAEASSLIDRAGLLGEALCRWLDLAGERNLQALGEAVSGVTEQALPFLEALAQRLPEACQASFFRGVDKEAFLRRVSKSAAARLASRATTRGVHNGQGPRSCGNTVRTSERPGACVHRRQEICIPDRAA